MALSIQINNDKFLDLSKREYVALSYQVFDLGKLESRQGAFTNDFDIPNTDYNRALLGYATEDNIYQPEFSATKKIPARVYNNNIMVSDGFIQIVEFSLKTIRICFFGDNVNIWEAIKGKKLKEIDLSYLRHVYNATNVINSFGNTSGYIYLPIDYGNFTARTLRQINAGEIFPAIFVDDITKGIFRQAGFKVSGSLLSRSLYKKSVIPFTNAEFGYSDDFATRKSFYAINRSAPPVIPASSNQKYNFNETINFFGGKLYSNELFDLSTDRYTADEMYAINISFGYNYRALIMENFPLVERPILKIYKNGVQAYSTTAASIDLQQIIVFPGDYFEFYIHNHNPANPNIKVRAWARIIVFKEIIPGSIVFPEIALPDMSQTDFIKWLIYRFNLLITVDSFTNTVYLDQFNDIKFNAVDDWSDKVDLKKEPKIDKAKIVSNYAKRNIGKYTLDESDFLQTAYSSSNNGLAFGSGVFNIDNDFLPDEKDIFETPFSGTFINPAFGINKIKLPYIPRYIVEKGVTLSFQSSNTSNEGGFLRFTISGLPSFKERDRIQITNASETSYNGVWEILYKFSDISFYVGVPYVAGSSGDIKFFPSDINVPAPRCLTVYGLVDLIQISDTVSLEIMGQTVTEIPFSYFFKGTYGWGIDDFKESLAFSIQNIPEPNDNGAFETDYADLINALNNPEMRIAYLRINQLDIINLKFLQKKYIERFGGYFYLNLLDEYDGSGDSVLCELVKI
jgi:hypothetical protein